MGRQQLKSAGAGADASFAVGVQLRHSNLRGRIINRKKNRKKNTRLAA
jgi:hypothetical protein